MTRVRNALRDHPWLSGAFLTALVLTLFFATRMISYTIYWSDPAHQYQAVQGWMTPGYVANSWDIPHQSLQSALGDLAQPGDHKTLKAIAEDSGTPLPDLIARIEAAIAAQKAAQ